MTTKERKKVITYLLLIVLVTAAFAIWGSKIDANIVASFIQKMGFWGKFVFVILLIVTQVAAPVSGMPLLFAGYLMFASNVLLYSYLASMVSSIINFSIARKWGRAWIIKMIGNDDMKKVDTFTQHYGVGSLIFLRIFQGHLNDFISYAYGLTNMKMTPYMVVTIFAPIPWLSLWYLYIFPRVGNVGDFSIWFLIMLIPLFVISWFYSRYIKRKK
ncbi:MAG TPA: VTT domain-containing protein [Patescibacteria group bacterium]|nr:VTT domain-containing protein [Patescibacteria group bacterium]